MYILPEYDPILGQLRNTDVPTSAQIIAALGYTPVSSTNIAWKHSVRASTTTGQTLPTYTVSPDFLTLTASANGAFITPDGVTLIVGDTVLVKNEAGGLRTNNGAFSVIQIGSVSTPWILTRVSDSNTSASLLAATYYIRVGTVEIARDYTISNPTTILGTTLFTFSLIGSGANASNLNGGVAGAIPYQSAASTTGFSAAGTTGQILQSNGSSAPTWTTATYPSTTFAKGLLYGSITNVITQITSTPNAILVSNVLGTATWQTTTANRLIVTLSTNTAVSSGVGYSNNGTITLIAGTTTFPPLIFSSGTNLTTTVGGAVEYNGTHLYFTATNGGTRFQLDQQSPTILGTLTSINSLTVTGQGVPIILGLDYRTGLTTTDGSPITLYTTVNGTSVFRVTADIFATAFTSGTAIFTITWTQNSTTQTLVVNSTVLNTLGTATDLITPDNGTAITTRLTGTFVGTFIVTGVLEQLK